LRARLVALFALLALATTLVFVAGTGQVFSNGWRDLARPLITDYVSRLAAEIGSPPDIAKAQALTQRLPITIAISGPVVQWRSAPLPERAAPDRHPHDPAARAMLTRRTADGHELRFGLRNLQWDDAAPNRAGWITLGGLLGLTALAFALVRRLLKPLDDIRAGTQRYEAGDFSQSIPERRRDELGDLAGRVNDMASGLKRMLDGQRGLLLAISHELRSPLTRARLNAELLADGAEREALLRDLGQMRDLIANLLESERLAADRASLQRQPTDLAALVRGVVDAQFAGQPIALTLADGLPALPLDVARIELLVRNLLDNALRHGAGGHAMVEVSLQRVGAEVALSVRDHGPGVDAEHLARLAEPFYRTDQARTRHQGGVGLGLYLCRQVALSHGGQLDIRRAEPGLAVVLVLPINADETAGADRLLRR
jgi:signal transduction histidine kinase